MTDNDRVEVTQGDRDAMKAFHAIQIKRIISGDRTLGEDAGDNGALVQAFARHRLAALSGAGGSEPTDAAIDAGRFAYKDGVAGKRGISRDDVRRIWSAIVAASPALATHPGEHPDAGEGGCQVPPAGWQCSRAAGHEGPCAATPTRLPNQHDAVEAAFRAGHAAAEETLGAHGSEHLLDSIERAWDGYVADHYLATPSAPAGDGARREAIERPEDYILFADQMLAKLFYPSGACRMDAKPYGIAKYLAHAVRVLARAALSTQATDREKVLEEAGQTVRDALMDSQYLAGAKAGWNAAQADDPEAAYAALVKSREGHLAGFCDARRALAQAPSEAGHA